MNEEKPAILECCDAVAEVLDFVIGAFEVIATAFLVAIPLALGALIIVVSSPIWIGPFLLWRKFRKEYQCSE